MFIFRDTETKREDERERKCFYLIVYLNTCKSGAAWVPFQNLGTKSTSCGTCLGRKLVWGAELGTKTQDTDILMPGWMLTASGPFNQLFTSLHFSFVLHLFIIIIFKFTWKAEIGKGEKETNLSITSSLLKCLLQPRLSQAEAKRLELSRVSPVGDTSAVTCCLRDVRRWCGGVIESLACVVHFFWIQIPLCQFFAERPGTIYFTSPCPSFFI